MKKMYIKKNETMLSSYWQTLTRAKLLVVIFLLFGLTKHLVAQTNIFVGTGTVNTAGTSGGAAAANAGPYGICVSSGAMGKKLQIIYTAAQINAAMTTAGYTPGTSFIHSITWDIATAIGTGNPNNLGYTIKMANSAQSQFVNASGFYSGSMTTVYGATNTTFAGGTGFTQTFTLSSPFQWDGTNNLIVEVCYTVTGVFIIGNYGSCRRTTTTNNQMIYNGGAAINCATGTYATVVPAIPNARLGVSPATPCSGAPASSTAGSTTVCPATSGTIGLTGLVGGSGYTYLWKYSATNGGPYSAASGTNNTATYTTPSTLPSNPAYYICEVTCSNSGLMTPSGQGTVTLANFLTCYCTTGFSSAAATAVRGLTNVNLVGNSVTLNNTTAANTANPSPYNLYATPVADLTASSTYSLKTTVGTATNNLHYVTAWIDYDQDGKFGGYSNLGVANPIGPFGVGGLVLERIVQYGPTTNVQTTNNFTIPANATPGTTAMRVRYRYGATQVGWGSCEQYTGTATSGGAGEVEDYRVLIVAGCAVPSTAASASSASNLQPTSADLGWINGDGDAGRVIVLRQGSAVNASPTSGTAYTANSTFGSGDQIGTGNYVVYNGTGSSTTINGLLPSTTYHYSIFEYNAASTCYTLSGHTGSFTTGSCSPSLQASGVTICAEYTGLNLAFTRGNGDRTLVVARAGSAVNADPAYNTSYTANAAFGSGTQIGTGNYVVYNGNSPGAATLNLTGLTQGTTYHFKFYEFFESPNCYNLSSVPTASSTTRNSALYTSSTTTQNSTTVAQNALAQQIIGLQVVVGGGADPAATINSITFNTTGSTNTGTDITKAKIYYTGTSSTFATNTQFGSTFTSFAGNLTATDNFALLPGTNYFWVAYDLNLNATISNVLDAQVVSFNMTDNSGTSDKTPSVTAPAGSRTIISSAPGGYCTPSHNNSVGDCVSGVNFAGTPYTGATTCGNYVNNTAISGPTVTPGSSYTLSFFADDFIGNTTSVWFDWNRDGTFNSSGNEMVSLDGNTGSVSFSVTVPIGASPGATRMRVLNRFPSAGSNACIGSNGSSTSGITLDFTVTVSGASGVQAVSCETPLPSITTPVTYARNDVASALSATGTSLLWYTLASGGVGSATAPTPITSNAGTTAYYVSQNTGCESPRTQIAVTVTSACGPIAQSVTGGNDCNSVTVGLASTELGVNYQLLRNGTPIGSPIAGTGSSISFGVQTITGVYTVEGTDLQPVTSNMSGNSTIWEKPTAMVSGSLLGCSPAGVVLGTVGSLAGSGTILGRQWQENGIDIPSATATTYNATTSNDYSVVLTNSNGCTSSSSDYSVVINNPPTASISGSAPHTIAYTNCAVTVGVSKSPANIIYEATALGGAISWTHNGAGSISAGGTTAMPTYTPAAGDAGNTVTLTLTVTPAPPCSPANANYQIQFRTAPTITIDDASQICTIGNPYRVLSVSSAIEPNTNYTWPANDLYLDPDFTFPYISGMSATTVYSVPFGTQVYTVTATDVITNCSFTSTPITVTVCPALTQSICDADANASVPVGTSATFSQYNLVGSTASVLSTGPSCGMPNVDLVRDAFFRVTIPTTGEIHVVTAPGTNSNTALRVQRSFIQILAGENCNSTSIQGCNRGGGAGLHSYAYASGLTPGQTAYIRIASVADVYTSLAGVSNSGTTITVANTAGLDIGMIVTVVGGTGSFPVGTVVSSITNATTFEVSQIPIGLSGTTVIKGRRAYPEQVSIGMNITDALVWSGAGNTDFFNATNWMNGDATALTLPAGNKTVRITKNIASTPQPLLANNYTSAAGASSVTTTVTVASTTGLKVGMVVRVASGGGSFTAGTSVTAVTSATTFSVNIPPVGLNGTTVIEGSPIVKNLILGVNSEVQVGGTSSLGIYGNISASNNIIYGQGFTNLIGTSEQQFNGTVQIYNLAINNPAGAKANSPVRFGAVKLQNGPLTTLGNVTILSDPSKTGYIDNFSAGYTGVVVGDVTIERRVIASANANHFISSPVTTALTVFQNYNDDFSVVGTPANYVFSTDPSTPQPITFPNTWTWNETLTNPYTNGYTNAIGTVLAPGQGINAAISGVRTLDIKGPINTGAISRAVTFTDDGFNLVGNPYPSSLKFNDLFAANSGLILPILYVWNPTNGNYATYNGTVWSNNPAGAGSSDVLGHTQGMYVIATSSGNLNFTNSMRTINNPGTFFSAPTGVIKLEVTSNGKTDETVVMTQSNASENYDQMVDAKKLLDGLTPAIQLFTVSADNTPLAINAMDKFSAEQIIPLQVIAENAGEINIKLAVEELSGVYEDIYLEDATTGTFTNLKAQGSYRALVGQGNSGSRFFLHFAKPTTTSATATELTVYSANNNVFVNLPSESNGTIEVMDMAGKTIYTSNFSGKSGRISFNVPNAVMGNYLVKLTSNGKVISQKVMLSE